MSRYSLLFASLCLVAPVPGWLCGDVGAQERPEAPRPPVQVQGVVVDHESGDSLTGAAVSLGAGPSGAPGRGTRVTGEDGRFRFEDVPAGTYRVIVRLEGYRDMNDTLQVSAEGDLELVLPLSTGVAGLGPRIVPEEMAPPVPRYEQRRRGGARFLVTREQIEERRPRLISELLHSVPGGMVVRTPPYGYTLLLRGQCRPGIWMDGVEMSGVVSIDQVVTPQDVQALEVFHAFEFPVEYGVNPCGGILVWTRRAPSALSDDDEPMVRGGLLGRLLGAAALVLVVVILTR